MSLRTISLTHIWFVFSIISAQLEELLNANNVDYHSAADADYHPNHAFLLDLQYLWLWYSLHSIYVLCITPTFTIQRILVQSQLGSGPRYQILSHVFARCASKKKYWHARIACKTQAKCMWFKHVSVLFDLCNMQKSVTQIIYLGPWPLPIVHCLSTVSRRKESASC